VTGVVLALITMAGSVGAYYLLGPLSPLNLRTSSPGTPGVVHTGTDCGVKKNSDGTYSFSWLHVAPNGLIADEQNCIVPLVGFNMGGLFLGDAGSKASLSKIQAYKNLIPMNVARVNFNTRWWVDNVEVPHVGMRYRQWLQQYVSWQKQVGNYVMLDKGPHFNRPPCDGVKVKLCPSQDQGKKDYEANPNEETAKGLETYIGFDVQAWHDLAKIYANDPAIIYDAWNEPTIKDLNVFFQDMNTLINTIREQHPRSLIIVYQRGYKDMMSGKFPLYKQPNLVIDAHVYPKFSGISPATGEQCESPGKEGWTPQNSNFDAMVQFAHSHGHGFIINEWGGCYDVPEYHRMLTSYARQQGIGLVYYHAGDVVVNANAKTVQINANGRLVQQAYADILKG
jgi:hypothetical protein